MKNLMLFLFLLFSFSSCTDDIASPTETATKSRGVDVQAVLNDLENLHTQMAQNKEEALMEKLVQLDIHVEEEDDINVLDYFEQEFNVERALIDKIVNYDPEIIELLQYEIDNPGSGGDLHEAFIIGGGGTEPEPCGGWRTLRLIASTAAVLVTCGSCLGGNLPGCGGCLLTLPSVLADWASYVEDGCLGGG